MWLLAGSGKEMLSHESSYIILQNPHAFCVGNMHLYNTSR